MQEGSFIHTRRPCFAASCSSTCCCSTMWPHLSRSLLEYYHTSWPTQRSSMHSMCLGRDLMSNWSLLVFLNSEIVSDLCIWLPIGRGGEHTQRVTNFSRWSSEVTRIGEIYKLYICLARYCYDILLLSIVIWMKSFWPRYRIFKNLSCFWEKKNMYFRTKLKYIFP